MKHVLPHSLRFTLVAAAFAAGAANPAFAQTAAVSTPAVAASGLNSAAPTSAGRPEQAIQRIRTEDAGTRIDEVRVGGETQSITVQPKTGQNTPAYEVKPAESAKGNPPSSSSGDTNGSRVWNVFKF